MVFAAQFAGFASEITQLPLVFPPISIGIDSGDPTGNTDHNWTANVLTDGLKLGFVPGFISDHVYVQGAFGEGDENLLLDTVSDSTSNDDWGQARDATYQFLSCTHAFQRGRGRTGNGYRVQLGKQSPRQANNESGQWTVSRRLAGNPAEQWLYRRVRVGICAMDGSTDDNNSNDLYGWREGGDYGLLGDPNVNLPPSTSAYIPYPSYFAEQIGSKIAQIGGKVLAASSNYDQFDSFAVLEPNGDLDLLAINANPAASLTEQFDLQGFQPTGQRKSSNTARHKTPLKVKVPAARWRGNFTDALSLSGASFSYTFPAYSMTVIDLAPGTAQTGGVSGR